MSNMDQLLWRAIEGALGAEKRAFLQNAPLSSVVGSDAHFAIPHAIGAIAATGHQKHAENASIQSGLQALALVAKEANIAPTESFTHKVARAYKLRTIEPYISGGHKQAAAQTRRALGAEIMTTVKHAAVGTALSGIISNPVLRDAGKKMLGGAAIAGGAALPTYAVGSALSDKFTEDARNRALQTAGGVTGIGLLGYGAKSLMDQAGQDHSREQNYAAMDRFRRGEKMSSEKVAAEVYAAMLMPQEKIAHLATCVYVDELLEGQEQTHKVAALRDLNNEFLVELLATSVKMSQDNPVMALKQKLDKIDAQKATGKPKKKLQAGKPVSQPKRTYETAQLGMGKQSAEKQAKSRAQALFEAGELGEDSIQALMGKGLLSDRSLAKNLRGPGATRNWDLMDMQEAARGEALASNSRRALNTAPFGNPALGRNLEERATGLWFNGRGLGGENPMIRGREAFQNAGREVLPLATPVKPLP